MEGMLSKTLMKMSVMEEMLDTLYDCYLCNDWFPLKTRYSILNISSDGDLTIKEFNK